MEHCIPSFHWHETLLLLNACNYFSARMYSYMQLATTKTYAVYNAGNNAVLRTCN